MSEILAVCLVSSFHVCALPNAACVADSSASAASARVDVKAGESSSKWRFETRNKKQETRN